MSQLTLHAVNKTFGSNAVVKDFNLTMGEGEFVSLLGPSGCGKTTVLRMVAGFETPSAGKIAMDGVEVTTQRPAQRKIGMMFQSYALFPNLTVAGNVAFGLKVAGIGRDETAARVDEMLRMVGLAGFGARYPWQLSGGQQQRVALARAIAPRPRVLLLDEPLSALDAKIRISLRAEIRSIQKSLGITTLFVTHDQEEAMEMSDRIVVMRQGRVEQEDTPGGLYARPATLAVAQFIGQMNVAVATARNGTAPWMGAEIGLPISGDVTLACRPEDVQPDPDGVPLMVQQITDLGPLLRLSLVTPSGETLIWLAQRDQAPAPGARITLWPRRLHLFREGQLVETITPHRIGASKEPLTTA